MRRMLVLAIAALLALGAAACGDDDDSGGSSSSGGGEKELSGKIAVLLPGHASRPTAGRRPIGASSARRSRPPACRRRLHDQERPGRSGDAADAGRAGDHRGRQGDPAHEPRLGQRRGDHRRRQVPGRDDDRLRPPDAEGRRRLLRLRRRDRGRPPAGQGPHRGPREGRASTSRGRDPRRRADRLVRDRPQEGLQRGAQAEVRLRRVHEGRPAGGAPTGTASRR